MLSGLPADTRSAPTVVLLGDSLSAGYGLAQNQSWAARLAERLAQLPTPRLLHNASISGETSAGGAARIDALLKAYHPELVIVELGANDGLRGLPVTELENNLDRIVSACLAAGSQVILIPMRLPPNYGTPYTRAFENVYTTISRRYRIALTPFLLSGLSREAGDFQNDGLHPGPEAQGRILENVWPAIRARLPPHGPAAP